MPVDDVESAAATPPDEPEVQPEPQPEVQKLDMPRDGVPPVIADRESYLAAVEAMAAGTGPVAVDAERASGHRYGQRAFLVQLRREGAGTILIDPVPLPDLSELNEALAGTEWILHAASQDLPCLAEIGMHPTLLFDTELGGRLAGYPRVGLAAMVESLLGLSLAKEHSAVDWSTRPLPEPWLRYAALDVEVLVDLRDQVAADLERQGKLEWAREEFAAVAAAPPPPPRVDPWRRTSGMHRVRDRRRLAAVRELWNARDEIARERDVSPGRVLPDSSIVEAAVSQPVSLPAMLAMPGFTGRGARRSARKWFDALEIARQLPDSGLPAHTVPGDGPPPPRVWAERDPAAAHRLGLARVAIAALGAARDVPVENLLTPELVRRLCWTPPQPATAESVSAALAAAGARRWQLDLTVAPLVEALNTPPEPKAEPQAEREPEPEAEATDEPKAPEAG